MPSAYEPVQIDGLKDLIRRLRNVENGIQDLKEVHREAAGIVGMAALVTAPVRTGRMAVTMRVGVTQKTGIVRFGYASVPYAGPVHWGWGTRPNPARGWRGGPIIANPWASEAAQATEPAWYEVYASKIDELWDRM